MSIDLSLDRIRQLLDHLPIPYTRPTIHVAGTNGKGSVCALVASILSAASPPLVVGRFNSPHLLSPLDGIFVRNEPVDRHIFMEAREEVQRRNEEHCCGATSFEMYTCYALLIFERLKVDVVVLEVGMGGRLDATNVVPDESILISALTSVDLDHQAFLGDTVEAITREKAAIARRGKPFVVGPQAHQQVEAVARFIIHSSGGEIAVPCAVVAVDWDPDLDGAPVPTQTGIRVPQFQPVHIHRPCHADPIRALLPLHGEHQLGNLDTAMGIISALQTHPACERPGLNFDQRLTPDAISRGIRATRWPGRLSYHAILLSPASLGTSAIATHENTDPESSQILVLADGAHNPASAAALAAYITSTLGKSGGGPVALTYILALSHSPPKTPEQTLKPLLAIREGLPHKRELRLGVALLPFTPPLGMPWIKFVPPSDIRAAVDSLVPPSGVEILESSSDFGGLDYQEAPIPVEPPRTDHVEEALRWAASRRRHGEDSLVVLAGSLYLVADFYRLLQELGQAGDIWGSS
ncbi:Mur ligase [Dichomitus squalens]|uniref:Mur ligase n=1 Tax=Dichomitus squalens TaxID=114155 RepID=A0A4Q9Q4L7_9APHY|nr:Mur ligase [Dichomitus squalens]